MRFWLPFSLGMLVLLLMAWVFVSWDMQLIPLKRLPLAIRFKLLSPLLCAVVLFTGIYLAAFWLLPSPGPSPTLSRGSLWFLHLLLAAAAAAITYVSADGMMRRVLRLQLDRPSGLGGYNDPSAPRTAWANQ